MSCVRVCFMRKHFQGISLIMLCGCIIKVRTHTVTHKYISSGKRRIANAVYCTDNKNDVVHS